MVVLVVVGEMISKPTLSGGLGLAFRSGGGRGGGREGGRREEGRKGGGRERGSE